VSGMYLVPDMRLTPTKATHKFGVEHSLRCSFSLLGESATGQSLATLNRSRYSASLENHLLLCSTVSGDMSCILVMVLPNERDALSSKHHSMHCYKPYHSSLLFFLQFGHAMYEL
jgi:hypothetical protein